jgi:putative SOS response-associated peptidase YedK
MSHVHDRMPAIVPREAFSNWLDVDGVEPAKAMALVAPAPETALELVPIGTRVNKVGNDDAGLQAPTGEALRSQACPGRLPPPPDLGEDI